MSPTRNHPRRSSVHPPRTQDRSRPHIRSPSYLPYAGSRRPRSRTRVHSQVLEERSPNTLTGRDLTRALNKASERGTQGKEMYVYMR